MDIVALFCDSDDFCTRLEPQWHRHRLAAHLRHRQRRRTLGLSEVRTFVVWFPLAGSRNSTTFSLHQIC